MKSLFIDFSKGFNFSSRRKKNILSLFVQLKIRNYKRNFSGYFFFKNLICFSNNCFPFVIYSY